MNWKRHKQVPVRPSIPTDYPSDLFVLTEDGVYYIKGKTKFKLYSERVFESWSASPVLGSTASISKFLNGGYLGFRNGTLINNYADGKIYLISGNKRRLVVSPDVYSKYGITEKWIQVSQAEVNLHDEGEPLE